jgi:hypothetical protein
MTGEEERPCFRVGPDLPAFESGSRNREGVAGSGLLRSDRDEERKAPFSGRPDDSQLTGRGSLPGPTLFEDQGEYPLWVPITILTGAGQLP